MPCALSPPVNSSFNIMLLWTKSVNCVLIIVSVSNCFGDWINEEPNCCVTNGFHLITRTHFWLCCLFIYRHANCQKVFLGMRTRSVANASTICITVYRQQFNPLLLCTILVFYMCIYSMCLCLFLCAMKEYKIWKIINCCWRVHLMPCYRYLRVATQLWSFTLHLPWTEQLHTTISAQ